jgi:hypothetical protein
MWIAYLLSHMAEQAHTTAASLPIDHRSPSADWADNPLSTAALTALLTVLTLMAVSYPIPAAAVAAGWLLQRLLRR